jgi:hypothetical protein
MEPWIEDPEINSKEPVLTQRTQASFDSESFQRSGSIPHFVTLQGRGTPASVGTTTPSTLRFTLYSRDVNDVIVVLPFTYT